MHPLIRRGLAITAAWTAWHPTLLRAECAGGVGDGVLDSSEECDDGNAAAEDGCSPACSIEYCGDGLLQPGLDEECDDGAPGIPPGDIGGFCDLHCRLSICGNGLVSYSPHGNQFGILVPRFEECDDGNAEELDGCSNCEWDTEVDFLSEPSGAEVWVGDVGRGTRLGLTPLADRRFKRGTYRFSVARSGFVPIQRTLFLLTPNRTLDERLLLGARENYAAAIPIRRADGSEFRLPSGQAAMEWTDLTCDGVEDVLVGDAQGRVRWWRNLDGRVPALEPQTGLVFVETALGRAPLRVESGAAPTAADFNLDSQPDLLVGDAQGRVHLFAGTGYRCQPTEECFNEPDLEGCVTIAPRRFKPGTALQTGGADLDVGEQAVPFAADMDGDHVPDLVVGNSVGEVWWYRQTIGDDAASLQPGVVIFQASDPQPARPVAEDLDYDGRADLLVALDGRILIPLRVSADGDPPSFAEAGPWLLRRTGPRPTDGESDFGAVFFRLSDLYFDFFRQRDLVLTRFDGMLTAYPALHVEADVNRDGYANGLDVIAANLNLGRLADPEALVPVRPPFRIQAATRLEANLLDIPTIAVEAPAGQSDGQVDAGDRAAMQPLFASDAFRPQPACGNRIVEPGELCDFGDANGGDGCDAQCRWECGDGMRDPQREACDDGNRVGGDGCDAQCRGECGNGRADGNEVCDDGGLCLAPDLPCGGDFDCPTDTRCFSDAVGADHGYCARPEAICFGPEDCSPGLVCRPVDGDRCAADCRRLPLPHEDARADLRHCGFNLRVVHVQAARGSMRVQWDEDESFTALPGQRMIVYLDLDRNPATGSHALGGAEGGGAELREEIGWEKRLILDSDRADPTNPRLTRARLEPDGIDLPGRMFGRDPEVEEGHRFIVVLHAGRRVDTPFHYLADRIDPASGPQGSVCDRFPDEGFRSSDPETICGDMAIDPGEECDDGNLLRGDGCTPACLVEIP